MVSSMSSRTFRHLMSSVKSSIHTLGRRLSTQAELHKDLLARPPNVIYDYLSPTSSHLLNISLADFLPNSCYPANFRSTNLQHVKGVDDDYQIDNSNLLPQGHHLVYFSAQVTAHELLPDGTDTLHSPGKPFSRRLWAGGSLRFNLGQTLQLPLNGTHAVKCVERVTDVLFKGFDTMNDGKVFVNVERRIGMAQSSDLVNPECRRTQESLEPSIVETRTLVFMKEKSAAAAKEDAGRPDRIIKAPHKPDFSVVITPTKSLLFRFSALSFNAHFIHLDPEYAREVEGHRGLLVHGPLTLVLMLSVLRKQLHGSRVVKRFDYKNLAPLFVDEEMKICVLRAKDSAKEETYQVWIEGNQGGMAVKGTAIIAECQQEPDEMR